MVVGKEYEVITQIKLHTKPLRIAQIKRAGRFVRETEKHYIFSNFRSRKENVISISERRCTE